MSSLPAPFDPSLQARRQDRYAHVRRQIAERVAEEIADEFGIITDTADERISTHGDAGSIREMLTRAAERAIAQYRGDHKP